MVLVFDDEAFDPMLFQVWKRIDLLLKVTLFVRDDETLSSGVVKPLINNNHPLETKQIAPATNVPAILHEN